MPIVTPPLKNEQSSKITAFQTTFSKNVSRPNLFHVQITAPVGLQSKTLANELELRVQSVTMPGKNISTTPNDNAYGPSYEIANGISYAEEIEVTYILDQDHRAREFFNNWQDKIVDPSSYDLKYYKDYIGEMTIYQLDQNDNNASAVQVHQVFPKSVGPIQYSMESGSAFLTVSVNMAFRNWTPLIVNFQGTDVAGWIDDSSAQPSTPTGLRSAQLNALYKIRDVFGVGLPPGAESGLNQMRSISKYASDPVTFLKKSVSRYA